MDRPSRSPLKGERPPQSPLKGDDSPKSPFKGDLEGPGDLEGLSPKSPFKGDLEGPGNSEGPIDLAVPNAPKWQVADPLAYTILKENSKNNRRNLTKAETVFWKIAKSSGLGEKCRRQYIIGQYIVDFFFRKSKLIVELDGAYHFSDEQQKEDVIRQEWLEKMGYTVIRFTNEDILFNTENVITHIKSKLISLPLREI
jgi:very-short-patch-repair endonuclease